MECFNILQPSALLSPYILYYWVLETVGEVTERTIPFGHVQLIFHSKNSLFSSSHNSQQPNAFISGMSNSYTDLKTTGDIRMFVVAFRPEGARAFLNIPMQLFHNNNISVDDIADQPLKELSLRVREETDNQKVVQLIEHFFLNRLYNFDRYKFNRLLPAIDLINQNEQVSISQLATTACLSPKQFNRLFTEYVGSTPKEFFRIIRFQRTLYTLQSHPGMSLTRLAYEVGYYDQPHLIKDFRGFSGYTPTEFMRLCAPTSDYFTHL